MNWLESAKKWAENGSDPNVFYTMPFCRLYAVFFAIPDVAPTIDTVGDLRILRNEKRKRLGLPLIPEPKAK